MFSYWNTDINIFHQEVAVEDFVLCMAHIGPLLLLLAVSATLIGIWQTDFVIDHNAQGK